MRLYHLHREQLVARPVNEVFAFFSQARNLELITPPWLRFEVLTREPIEMAPGVLTRWSMSAGRSRCAQSQRPLWHGKHSPHRALEEGAIHNNILL
jgi:ligand-binding SRPBCC domain-containing protein